MNKRLVIVTCLIVIFLFACAPALGTPSATPSLSSTSTAITIETSTITLTPTATITPSKTITPIPFQLGIFNTTGPVPYYFDPSLRTETGTWQDKFYICVRYVNISKAYDSYEIAETNKDCINRNTLGWVESEKVVLGDGNYDGFMTIVSPEAKQCEDGIDNDRDEKIDYPSDPDCDDASDDWEDAAPPIIPPLPPPPNEKVKILSPADGTTVCHSVPLCEVNVVVRWENQAPGNTLCYYVSVQGNVYPQPTGFIFIGPASNNTVFRIIVVSAPSCTPNIPSGESSSVRVTRVNGEHAIYTRTPKATIISTLTNEVKPSTPTLTYTSQPTIIHSPTGLVPTDTSSPQPIFTLTPTIHTNSLKATQMVQAVFDEVNRQFQNIKSNIAYNPPKTMKLDETVTIDLLLNPSSSQMELATEVVEGGIDRGDYVTSIAEPSKIVDKQDNEPVIVTSEIQITNQMKAELHSKNPDAFIIHALHDSADQPISTIDTTQWSWNVTAKNRGVHSLELVIYRLIKIEGTDKWTIVESYREDIIVEVTLSQWVKETLGVDWKWLLSTLLIPLFFWWINRKKHGDKKESLQRRRRYKS